VSDDLGRRKFLEVLLAAGGAMAVGVSLPGCAPWDAKTVTHFGRTGEFHPNAWVKIHPDDRVTLVLDRVEMGQGTSTSHATLLGEELEVDPRRIHVEHAPARREYDNPNPDLGFQITGGSTSVRESWEPLRKAGATAREMLKMAAATEWGVSLAEITVEDGTVSHAASGRTTTYGKLVKTAVRMPVPGEIALKPPSAMKWIGKSVNRVDAKPKVTGAAVYGIDVHVPGMLTAVVIRCPVIGGKPTSVEAEQAKASPGVVAVVTIPNGVAVVAKTYWEARTAAKLVRVGWDEGALAKVSTEGLRREYAARAKESGKKIRNLGNTEAALRGGRMIQAVYEVPYLAHATMEPQNATAHVTRDRCIIWAPTQSPGLAMEEAIRVTGLPRDAITVHTTAIGGGFGRRLQQDYITEALHVSKELGRPVKVVWSREDDMTHDHYRPMTYNVLRGAVDAEGKIAGWWHRIVSQSIVSHVGETWIQAMGSPAMAQGFKAFLGRTAAGLYRGGTITDQSAIEGAGDFTYTIPNMRVEHVPVEPGVPVGFWRAVGHSENAFIVESFLDELAHAAKKDPYEVRRALLASSPRHLGVLDRAAKEAGWGTPLPKGTARGIALTRAFGSYCAQVAEVSVEGRAVRVKRVVAAIDCGMVINPDLVRAQVESGILFGLSAALKQRVTFKDGRVEQTNFHQYDSVRMFEAPKIEVHIVDSKEKPSGVGEPGLPPIAPAVTNAIFAATGKRVRTLPIEAALKET
jgi:CO/xanthine dehydrogenase Mo-binding subunit